MNPENRTRSEQINIRVTPAVKAAIMERARSANSLSEYLESMALGKPPAVDRADLLVALNALRAIRAAMQPAATPEITRALFELTRLGNLQKHLYSEARAPLDRIDAVAVPLKAAIERVERAVSAALAPPESNLAASLLVRLEFTLDALSDSLGYERG